MKKVRRISGVILLLVLLSTVFSPAAEAAFGKQEEVLYQWDNVRIGGGGLVTGVVFHPKEEGLVYVRTDVGGAYRWDKEKQVWIPITDNFKSDQFNFYGIDGICVDPNDPDVVYIEAGKYPWNECDVFKSTDRGDTWHRTNLNQAFWGNGPRRHMGEPIAVDPKNSNIVYAGTAQAGLFRSEDGAQTWKLTAGIQIDDETNSVRGIVFDPTDTTPGYSKIVYASVVNKGLYKSTDGGLNWEPVPGSPAVIKRMEFANDGKLFLAAQKALYRYADGVWEDISPIPCENQEYAEYSAVAVNPKDSNEILAVGPTENIMKCPILRTTDGGKTWTDTIADANYTKINPWLEDDNFSSNTDVVAMDPFNPKHVYIADWFGVWETKDISALPKTSWVNSIWGIEEMCPFTAACPPQGKYRLMAAVADNDGYPLNDFKEYPKRKFADLYDSYGKPRLMSTADIDFCEEDTNFVARVGLTHYHDGNGGYSLDGGETWQEFENFPKDENGRRLESGRIAVSARKNPETGVPNIVLIPVANTPRVTTDLGKTWTLIESAGETPLDYYWTLMEPLASDRVNPNRFYICNDDIFYVSNDGGFNWEQTFTYKAKGRITLKSAPDMEGEVWLNTGEQEGVLYRSSDGGKTFTQVKGLNNIVSFGFGKAAPDRENPTVYAFGEKDGQEGVFRSVNLGKSWVRIIGTEQKVGLGCQPGCVEGDRMQFGVVYVGTDGRGLFYGLPRGEVLSENPWGKNPEDVQSPTGEKAVRINGVSFYTERQKNLEDTVFLPVREFANALGVSVGWDDAEECVVLDAESVIQQGANFQQSNRKIRVYDQKAVVGETEISLSHHRLLEDGIAYLSVEDFAAIFEMRLEKTEGAVDLTALQYMQIETH